MELADPADFQDQQRSERTVPGKVIPLLSMLTHALRPLTPIRLLVLSQTPGISFDRHPEVLRNLWATRPRNAACAPICSN